jgi:anthranilate phosphoribosyltransferase
MDGYDEISLTADTKVVTNKGEFIKSPIELANLKVNQEDLHGGETVDAAAAIFKNILEGNGTKSQNAAVLANAAMALMVTGKYNQYQEAFDAASKSLTTGEANACLQKLISLQ